MADIIENNANQIDTDIGNNITNDENLKTNDTLLISESLGKVILPYTKEEVKQILQNESDKYQIYEQVIEDKFTRSFSDYNVQFLARYKETIKLATEREEYSVMDSITLALEMMKKTFLHPAIISACRNLDELDVYLDCLDKNELEEFKIFNIKYELHPVVIKQFKIFKEKHIVNDVKKFFDKIFSIKIPSKKVSKHLK